MSALQSNHSHIRQPITALAIGAAALIGHRRAAARVASGFRTPPRASVLLPMVLLAMVGCSRAATGPVVTVHAASGDAAVSVELALTREEQARGLMYRSELAESSGMLFVFDEEEERSFWMSNTPIPLDILYIRGDSVIGSIAARTTPYSERQIPSRVPVRYVLEVPGGWSERHGVKPGDRVTLPRIDPAPTDSR